MNSSSRTGTREALQEMGVSEEDTERYLAIDEKLREKSSTSQVQTRMSQPLTTTEGRVQEIMESGLQPLMSAIGEIRATLTRELEEERLVLRNYLTAVQNDMEELRTGVSQQLGNLGLLLQQQQQIPQYELPLSAQGDQQPTRQQEQAHRETASCVERQGSGHEAIAEAVSVESQDQFQSEGFDINRDVKWFKEQVMKLQEEQTKCSQELRRQDQQQRLQQNVSVSKSELRDELKATKDEILSSVRTLCTIMEGEISGSAKVHHKDTKNAMREMLTENQKIVHNEVTETISKMLSGNQGWEMSAVNEAGDTASANPTEGRDPVRDPVVGAGVHSLKYAMEKLQALTMGQSQRNVDKARNPQNDTRHVFHMYLPHFEKLIGSGGTVWGLPCAVDFLDTFMVVRGIATFSSINTMMILELERTVEACEVGLDGGKASSLDIKTTIKAKKSSREPDIVLDTETVRWGGDPTDAADENIVALGIPIECRQLVQPGYTKFKEDSLLVEFEITLNQKDRSMLSFFKG